MSKHSTKSEGISRRSMLKRTAVLAAGGAVGLHTISRAGEIPGGAVVTNGRIKQSLVHWCLETSPEKWTIQRTCEVARHLGCGSVELVAWKDFPVLQQNGLICAIVQLDSGNEPPFIRGWNNREFWPLMQKRTRDAIDIAAKYGYPNVITFTGYETKDPTNPKSAKISRDEGAANCIEGLKTVMGYAEQKKINVCIEILNSRVSTHPMKGHPGYQGDHVDYCADIMRGTGSPRAKLLFDIYHVQVMDGDVITRLRQHKDLLGHIHVAGVPGRCELDLPQQEINFDACMRALLDLGYKGWVGQEFVPTIAPLVGLRRAVSICDV